MFARVKLKYLNKGKEAVRLYYEDFVLCDAEERKYRGVTGLNGHGVLAAA
jgi:hypothetical protein